MNKNISFSQYKELYLSPHNQENDITNLKQDDTNTGWGFYTSLEPIENINESMIDEKSNTNTYKYLLQLLPLCVIEFFIG